MPLKTKRNKLVVLVSLPIDAKIYFEPYLVIFFLFLIDINIIKNKVVGDRINLLVRSLPYLSDLKLEVQSAALENY